MDISLFDFDLPRELIAQHPASCRSKSRLLVLNRNDSSRTVQTFKDIVKYFRPGDALVVNTTKVFKARLFGTRKTGGTVEVFLIRPAQSGIQWEALVSPSRRLKTGESIQFGDDTITLQEYFQDGRWIVRFQSEAKRKKVIAAFGELPLPPYLRRENVPADLKRYQTVYADNEKTGAVAAPTAGLHFTRSLLDELRTKGVTIIPLCLHVGPGTFKPVSVDKIEDHTVDPEFAELSVESAKLLNKTREAGGKVFAVGTTSVRTLESAPITNGQIQPFTGMVNLYIKPGFKFNIVDHLITNFHLPKSSLLILASAFAGRECILDAYHYAIAEKFRFYSYGDAMLVL